MINQTVNTETEREILEAARKVFQKKGFAGARMDDIAKAAGANKALLHYYFRSKQKLFEKVFEEALGQFFEKVVNILEGDLPLDVKIYRVVDMYSGMLIHNKHLPFFILGEIRENTGLLVRIVKGMQTKAIHKLNTQLQEEYEKGNIRQIPVQQFFLNLISLTVFPFVARPLFMEMFELEEKDFDQMINERRKQVPRMIIDMLRTR